MRALSSLISRPSEPLRTTFGLSQRAQQEDLYALKPLHVLESQVLPAQQGQGCATSSGAFN